MNKAFDLEDVLTIENGDGDDLSHFLAIQRAVNSGHAWRLQGSFGRTMMVAIEAGRVMLGENSARDYWGTKIPSRHEVQPGTKGSHMYVVEHFGEEWAKLMEGA